MTITQLRLAKVKDPDKLINGLKQHAKEFKRKNFAIFRSLLTPNIFILMTRYESLSESISQKAENASSNMQEKVGGFEIMDNGFYSLMNSNDPKNSLKNKFAVVGEFTIPLENTSKAMNLLNLQFNSNAEENFSRGIRRVQMKKIAGMEVNKVINYSSFPSLEAAEFFLSNTTISAESGNKILDLLIPQFSNINRGIFEIVHTLGD
tara:strand:+ start:887 stop:1504 length:618 start_codon:yes stop_codon:yes gene_type:complete